MGIKNKYKILPITYHVAMDTVIKHHYLHRKCPFEQGWGLYDLKDTLVGVVIYGTPASSSLRQGICGLEEKDNVIELSRLWVSDVVEKNGESYLIGNTLPLVRKEIVVSYADTSMGHLGVVYQATNWIYTGLSAKRTDWVVDGVEKHSHTLADKYTSKELREMYGDRFHLVPRSRKHRYVYINTPIRKRRVEILDKLRYPVLPYPKNSE